jgi:hypothetical protein
MIIAKVECYFCAEQELLLTAAVDELLNESHSGQTMELMIE